VPLAVAGQGAASFLYASKEFLLTRLRLLFALSTVLALAATLIACGDDDDGGNATNESPNQVLKQTISSDHEQVDSGTLAVSFQADVSGGGGGTVDVELSGPFDNQGEAKIPKFDLTVKADASGSGDSFDFEGGLISTSDAAFVSCNDSDYEIAPELFDRFKTRFESAAQQQSQNKEQKERLLKQLGLDNPGSLLTNLTNEGETDVEGAPTVHVSGDLDTDKAVEALKGLYDSPALLGALSAAGSQLPSGAQLDQAKEQLDQLKGAITEAHLDVYSGTEDDILRRLTIAATIEPPGGSTDKVDLDLDISFGAVNEPQTIEAPANPKPFDDLLAELGVPTAALDQLGALGGLGDSGGGGGSTSPALPGTTNPDQAQEYLNCVGKATSAADLQECQSLAP
jgi:hypothetical protein